MEPLRPTSVVRFGTYEVSLQSGEVRQSGLRIKVQQQPMKLLEILLEGPGEVVSREELRCRVWTNESFGDFDQALNIAIAKLRTALDDSAENPRFIETLPKRGYRFIADVSVVDGDHISKESAPPAEELPGIQEDEKKIKAGSETQGGLTPGNIPAKRQLRPTRPVMFTVALVLSLSLLA